MTALRNLTSAMNEDDRNALVAAAEALAMRCHIGQVDKLGQPYIEHVRAVAQPVASLGPNYQIVGLLHDSLEDCKDRTIVSLDILKEIFGYEISAAVDAMTRRDDEDYLAYLERVKANPISSAVKIADIAHNVSRIPLLLDQDVRNSLLRKYSTALEVLAN